MHQSMNSYWILVPSSTCEIANVMKSHVLNFGPFDKVTIGSDKYYDSIRIFDKNKQIKKKQLKIYNKNNVIYAKATNKSHHAFTNTMYSKTVKIGKAKTELKNGSIITLTKANYCTYYLFYINNIEPNKDANCMEQQFKIKQNDTTCTLQYTTLQYKHHSISYDLKQFKPETFSKLIYNVVNHLPLEACDLIVEYMSLEILWNNLQSLLGKIWNE